MNEMVQKLGRIFENFDNLINNKITSCNDKNLYFQNLYHSINE